MWDKFENTKGVIVDLKSNDRQCNGQKNKNTINANNGLQSITYIKKQQQKNQQKKPPNKQTNKQTN